MIEILTILTEWI